MPVTTYPIHQYPMPNTIQVLLGTLDSYTLDADMIAETMAEDGLEFDEAIGALISEGGRCIISSSVQEDYLHIQGDKLAQKQVEERAARLMQAMDG